MSLRLSPSARTDSVQEIVRREIVAERFIVEVQEKFPFRLLHNIRVDRRFVMKADAEILFALQRQRGLPRVWWALG